MNEKPLKIHKVILSEGTCYQITKAMEYFYQDMQRRLRRFQELPFSQENYYSMCQIFQTEIDAMNKAKQDVNRILNKEGG